MGFHVGPQVRLLAGGDGRQRQRKDCLYFRVGPLAISCNGNGTLQCSGYMRTSYEEVFVGMSLQTGLVYIDDIIVYGKSFEDELRHLRELFTRLEEANLKLSPKKCQLFQRSAEFLCNTFSGQDSKIETVRDWPTPKSPTEVQSFMGSLYLLPPLRSRFL